jgi:hypothetical protein
MERTTYFDYELGSYLLRPEKAGLTERDIINELGQAEDKLEIIAGTEGQSSTVEAEKAVK